MIIGGRCGSALKSLFSIDAASSALDVCPSGPNCLCRTSSKHDASEGRRDILSLRLPCTCLAYRQLAQARAAGRMSIRRPTQSRKVISYSTSLCSLKVHKQQSRDSFGLSHHALRRQRLVLTEFKTNRSRRACALICFPAQAPNSSVELGATAGRVRGAAAVGRFVDFYLAMVRKMVEDLVPPDRIELSTSSLPMTRSTTELRRRSRSLSARRTHRYEHAVPGWADGVATGGLIPASWPASIAGEPLPMRRANCHRGPSHARSPRALTSTEAKG